MKWETVRIQTPDGPREAIAPLVISASRATDLPAFHSEWFLRRLAAGYCFWRNPFNAAYSQYVSFERCRVVVFWTKNPAPLIPRLRELEARGINCYFQFTLNDYAREGLEPNVPALGRRIETFCALSRMLGRHRVIWRYDPIIVGGSLDVMETLARVRRLGKRLAPWTDRLVFSFVDWYKKIDKRLRSIAPELRAPDPAEMAAIAEGLADWNGTLARPLTLASCAEAVDLSALGIERNSCIDPALVARLCPESPEIQRLYGRSAAVNGPEAQARQEQHSLVPLRPLKDKGQRPGCGCAPSKDIGAYNTCGHLCAYCYANGSEAGVRAAMGRSDPDRDFL